LEKKILKTSMVATSPTKILTFSLLDTTQKVRIPQERSRKIKEMKKNNPLI
jgi:hypothetical protein